MRHFMRLAADPYEKIADGTKTIELRLFDEKRSTISVGDEIELHRADGSEGSLLCTVKALFRFDSFESLYSSLPLTKCGYTAETVKTASPADMKKYYSAEEEKRYGVVGIELELTELC